MKKLLLIVSMVMMAYTSYGQVTFIDTFDKTKPDSAKYAPSIEGSKSRITLTQNTTDKKEGVSSLQVSALIGAYHEWGSYAQVGYLNADSSVQNWSSSDTIAIWIKVTQAPKTPANMVFRIQVSDKPSKGEAVEQYIYENAVVLDSLHDWYLLKVPFIERKQPGADVPDGTGFILAPTSWGGFSYNNRKLDRDKIYDWTLGLITTGYTAGVNLPADSLIVLFDGFQRTGNRAVPVTFFNGKAYTAPVQSPGWSWGGSSMTIVTGAGTTSKANAIQWSINGTGWEGIGYNLDLTNMAGAWVKDSVQFKIKTDSDIDSLRIQFESANGKRGLKFKLLGDNAWHTYKFALSSLLFDDGKPAFDPSVVGTLGFMTNGQSAATNNVYTKGRKIYLTDLWTGNPDFDVIPPDAPTALAVTPGAYTNLITWLDTPNEPNAKYNVYFSEKAFTDGEADPTVETLPPFNLPVGTQSADHVLRAPVTDQNITYYYGVATTDAAGNVGVMAPKGPVTNKAKGVPTINKTAPANFKADAALTEWATIPPIVLNAFRNPATAHMAPNGAMKDSNDISVKAYLAVDQSNLYVAFDVVDDTVSVDTAATDYNQDSPDLFIGLYDWRGKKHASYSHGKTPDYHFRFSQNRIWLDNGGKLVMYPGTNYIWKKKTLTAGYTVEAMIPFTLLKSIVPSDSLFVPKEGMRIPIDFAVNDRDSKTDRDAILCYSTLNNDNSWEFMWRWTYTWIGSQWTTGVTESGVVPGSYSLEQNYPNPFNPSTKINFSLPKPGNVSLKVFDVLGREVMTLVNGFQTAGVHTAQFNASRLSSGMYIYKLDAGSFSSVKKMMLLK